MLHSLPSLVPATKCNMSVCLWLELCERFFFVLLLLFLFFFALLPPGDLLICMSTRPFNHLVQSPSHAQQPEEEEDGHEQEEGVLPIVIAVVEVAVAMGITCILI